MAEAGEIFSGAGVGPPPVHPRPGVNALSRLPPRSASLPSMDNTPSDFDPDFHADMQRRAREEFPALFAIAPPAEATIMDAAYVGAHAYRKTVQTPRPAPENPVRHALEIVTNNAEQLLLFVRDALHGAETFRRLPDDHRARIDQRLFG